MHTPNILAISGSTKKLSTANILLKQIKERYPNKINLNIYTDLDQLPHFNPDIENEQLPEKVSTLRQLIVESDGVLFCTPEYVFSIPGSLKNVIEWNVATTNFSNKPVAMIIAAASGKKAFESLALILQTIEAHLPNTSTLLIQGAKGKISTNNHITDAQLLNEIDVVIHSLIDCINKQSS